MTIYTRVDETSPYRCRPCDRQRFVDIAENEITGRWSMVHTCPACLDSFEDRTWRVPRLPLRAISVMSDDEADKVLAEASPAVHRLAEMRMS